MVFFFQQPVPNGKGWAPDLSPAASYGAIEFVFDKSDRPFADPKAALEKARTRLSRFNPEEDYLCWSNAGDVFSIYLVIAHLTARGFKKVRALQWQKARGDSPGHYLPSEIPLN